MKNTYLVIILLILFSNSLLAQDFTHSLDGIKWIKIETEAPVTIKAHNKEQLIIKAEKPEEKPDRSKGLKLITSYGEDNTGFDLQIVREGTTLKIINLRKIFSSKIDLLVPPQMNISVNGYQQADIEIVDISGEIEASMGQIGNLTLNNISGAVTASAMAGDIEIIFKSTPKGPITITTFSGAIDVTMPKDGKSDIQINSTFGNIYTDFDIKSSNKNESKTNSRPKIQGTINNGGVKISLTSSTGNIFIRQQ